MSNEESNAQASRQIEVENYARKILFRYGCACTAIISLFATVAGIAGCQMKTAAEAYARNEADKTINEKVKAIEKAKEDASNDVNRLRTEANNAHINANRFSDKLEYLSNDLNSKALSLKQRFDSISEALQKDAPKVVDAFDGLQAKVAVLEKKIGASSTSHQMKMLSFKVSGNQPTVASVAFLKGNDLAVVSLADAVISTTTQVHTGDLVGYSVMAEAIRPPGPNNHMYGWKITVTPPASLGSGSGDIHLFISFIGFGDSMRDVVFSDQETLEQTQARYRRLQQ